MTRLGYRLSLSIVVVCAGMLVAAQPISIADTIWLTAGSDRWKTWSGPFRYDATATIWLNSNGTWSAEQLSPDPIFFGEGTWTGDSKTVALAFDALGYSELLGWDLTGELQELGEPDAWAVATIYWAKATAKIKTPKGKPPKIKFAIQWKALVEFHGTAKFALGPWKLQRMTKTVGELWYAG